MNKRCSNCLYEEPTEDMEPCSSCNDMDTDDYAFWKAKTYKPKEEKPKEAEAVDKTVSTWEMIKLLLENTKRKGLSVDGSLELYFDNNILKYNVGTKAMQFMITKDDSENRWTIIEPEPVEVDLYEEVTKLRQENEQLKYECEKYKHFASKCGYFR